jgi:hypothetical protein
MWIELHAEGQPHLFNTDNLLYFREYRGKGQEGSTIVTTMAPELDTYHVTESYGEVKALLSGLNSGDGPVRGIHRAQPVYMDKT